MRPKLGKSHIVLRGLVFIGNDNVDQLEYFYKCKSDFSLSLFSGSSNSSSRSPVLPGVAAAIISISSMTD